MAEKVKLVPKSYRLPIADVEFIEEATKSQIFGPTESDVVRNLIAFAIRDLLKERYVKERLETMKLMRDASASKSADK